MCAVLQKKSVAGQHINLFVCGASLVAPGLVLTAAHCVADLPVAELRVRCGEWDTQQEIEPLEHQVRKAPAPPPPTRKKKQQQRRERLTSFPFLSRTATSTPCSGIRPLTPTPWTTTWPFSGWTETSTSPTTSSPSASPTKPDTTFSTTSRDASPRDGARISGVRLWYSNQFIIVVRIVIVAVAAAATH